MARRSAARIVWCPVVALKSGYFARYQRKLAPIIGEEAAAIAISFYKWLVSGVAIMLCGIPAGIIATRTQSGLVSALAGILWLVGVACMIRGGVLSVRGGPIASEYLSKALGYPVKIPVAKVSLRWWSDMIERERAKHETSAIKR
jgi:hypothetical protein